MAHPGTTPRRPGDQPPAPPQVNCDLCGWPMPLPDHCIRQGRIDGLLTCSACVEDTLAARTLETQQ